MRVRSVRAFERKIIIICAYLAQNLGITEYNHTVLRTGQGDVQTPRVVQETDTLVFVAPNTTEDDVVLLTTLERVDRGHLDLLVQVFLQRTVVLHVVDDIGALSFVRGDDTDLSGYDTRLEELGDDLLDVRRLGPGMK